VVDDEQQLPGLETASEVLPALESPGGPDRRLEAARQLAKDNPVAMAGIVRAWVNKE
jgi:flagellar M-ring protein FliF